MDYDPTDLDEESEREASEQTKARNKAEQDADDIRWLMSYPQGRRLMHKLIDLSGVHSVSFTGNSNTFFNEGRRSLGLEFMQDAYAHATDDYLMMLAEHRKDQDDGSSRTT